MLNHPCIVERIAVVSKTVRGFKQFAKSNSTSGYPLVHIQKEKDLIGLNLFGFVLIDEEYPEKLMNRLMIRIQSRHRMVK